MHTCGRSAHLPYGASPWLSHAFTFAYRLPPRLCLQYTFPPEFLWEAARREFKRWNDHGRRYVTYDRRYPFFQPKETQNHHLLQPTVAALCASWVPPVPPNVWV